MLRAVSTPNFSQIRNNISTTPLRIATIGTSLMQQSDEGSLSSYRVSHSSRGMLPWARAYAKGALYHDVVFNSEVITDWEPSGTPGATRGFTGLNFGVSGQTIAQIKSRLPLIMSRWGDTFDMIVVDAGTNDMATATTKESIQTDREYICDFFLSYGKVVVLLPILARDTSVANWGSGATARKKAAWCNAKSRSFVTTRRNCLFFDWNGPWVDKSSADGVPKTSYSSDGTHFAPFGGEACGQAFYDFIKYYLPVVQPEIVTQDRAYDATDNQFGNVLTNPFLTGTGGANGTGSSGNVATGYRVERYSGSACTVANTKETRSDGYGDWQVLTFTISGTADEVFYFRTSTANTTIPSAMYGKWAVGSCLIETNAGDCIRGITLVCDDNTPADGQYTEDLAVNEDDFWLAQSRSIMLRTPPMKINAASTNLRWRVEIAIKGPSTVAPVIKIGSVDWSQVTDPDLL